MVSFEVPFSSPLNRPKRRLPSKHTQKGHFDLGFLLGAVRTYMNLFSPAVKDGRPIARATCASLLNPRATYFFGRFGSNSWPSLWLFWFRVVGSRVHKGISLYMNKIVFGKPLLVSLYISTSKRKNHFENPDPMATFWTCGRCQPVPPRRRCGGAQRGHRKSPGPKEAAGASAGRDFQMPR